MGGESEMSVARRKILGIGLLAALCIMVVACVLASRGTFPPAVAAPLLLPGFVVSLVLSGGNVHSADEGVTVLASIFAWALLLGVPARILLTSD